MLFAVQLQLAERVPATIAGYRYAVEWFHGIMAYPSCINNQVLLLLDAISLVNHQIVVPKTAITTDLLLSLVVAALQRSLFRGDCWDRIATIIAVQQNSSARIHEILSAQEYMITITPQCINIRLTFINNKVASHRARQASRQQLNSSVSIPNDAAHDIGYKLILRWLETQGITGTASTRFLFPSPTSGSHITYSTIRIQLRALISSLGLDPSLYGTQSMRRGGAYDAMSDGHPLNIIRRRLRHASKSTSTFKYLPTGASSLLKS